MFNTRSSCFFKLGFSITIAAAIGLFCFWGCIAERTPPTRKSCLSNLKQIGCALHAYHDLYGTFPPAVTKDSTGQPLHSWRVLILPFMEEQDLYSQYDMSKPWDSPGNLQLLNQMPDVFRCATVDKFSSEKTPFLAIMGKKAAWSYIASLKMEDFTDGLNNTAMILELPEEAVPWTKPMDCSFPFKEDKIADISQVEDDSSVNVLFADGSIYGVKKNLLYTSLQAAFTRSQKDIFDHKLLRDGVEHKGK